MKVNREDISNIADKYLPEAISLNDYLADNPEISGEEFNSSERIVNILKDHGFKVEYPFSDIRTAFKAVVNKGKKYKFALLVEYDALPSIGHACGHCASGSISLLAALVLNQLKDNIDAEIHVIGTPDEEMRGSKATMANKGVFDEYDFAIMIHMSNKNVVFNPSLALDAYNFNFIGRPAHAASAPWEGRNALNALRLTMDAVDMMRQHVKEDVRIHSYIKEGGVASNIVPEFASMEILIRSKERSYLDELSTWVKDCGKAGALATRTKFEWEQLGEKFHEISEKPSGNKILEDIFIGLGLKLTDISEISSGSSDIGNVDYFCPAFHPMISIGEDFGPHTEEFAAAMKTDKTHRAIRDGGEIIVRFVSELYDNPELIQKIKEEHIKLRENKLN